MQTSHTITVGVYFLKISVSFCGKLQFHLIVWTPSDRRIHGQKYECSIYVNILYKRLMSTRLLYGYPHLR